VATGRGDKPIHHQSGHGSMRPTKPPTGGSWSGGTLNAPRCVPRLSAKLRGAHHCRARLRAPLLEGM